MNRANGMLAATVLCRRRCGRSCMVGSILYNKKSTDSSVLLSLLVNEYSCQISLLVNKHSCFWQDYRLFLGVNLVEPASFMICS